MCVGLCVCISCFPDRSIKFQKLCPGSSVVTNGQSLCFMSDKSDVKLITEAQTEKGSLALKAHCPHNSPIGCVSNEMKTWQ